MSNTDFLICFDAATYESFQKEIEGKRASVERFFSLLKNWGLEKGENEEDRSAQPLYTLKEWTYSSKYSNFPANCLYLYRWLISDGFDTFAENRIVTLYNYLTNVGVTDSAIGRVKWGIVFCIKEEPAFKALEDFWKENILKRFGIEKKDSLIFTELIDHFMVYHIGLKQLVDNTNLKEAGLSQLQETILTGYMNLVNRYPDLEAIFGVIIERDMFRVYELLKCDRRVG